MATSKCALDCPPVDHPSRPSDPPSCQRVDGPFKTRFCGAGNLTSCRNSLWQALKDAGDELAAAQGTNDPAQWRSDATAERIRFLSNFPITMRWTNRPTYQQAISYSGHR